MIVKNYAIKTLKDSKVEFAGVKVSNKYIDKEKSTDAYDVLKIQLKLLYLMD